MLRATALTVLLVAAGCTSADTDSTPSPKRPDMTTTTLAEGWRVGPSMQTELDTAEVTGVTTISDGETAVTFACFETSEPFTAKPGWSWNRIAEIGLKNTVIAAPDQEAARTGETVYMPFRFDESTLDVVATRLQDEVRAINGTNQPDAYQRVQTFGHCVAEAATLTTGA